MTIAKEFKGYGKCLLATPQQLLSLSIVDYDYKRGYWIYEHMACGMSIYFYSKYCVE